MSIRDSDFSSFSRAMVPAAAMDLVDCRLVANIVRSKSLTLGARDTFLSLPAASLRLKSLEHELGLRLFHRKHSGMVLTEAGHCFFEHAEAILANVNEMHERLLTFKDKGRRSLRVAANTSYITDFLPELVKEYLSKHPEVSIDVQAARTEEVENRIMEGRADIGFVSCPVAGFSVEPIDFGPDPLTMIVAANSNPGKRTNIGMREFAQCEHVVLGEKSSLTGYLRDRLAEHGLRLNVRVSVADYKTMLDMVAANIGVGLIHESLVRRYNHPNIRCISINAEWSKHRRYALVAESTRTLHYVNDFLTHVVDAGTWTTHPPPSL